MKKILLSTMGAVVIAFGGMGMAPSTASAGVAVDDDGKLVISGDARFRYEYDDRSNTPPAADQTRDRMRLRVRFGANYQADENWSMGFRLRTASDSNNSPHQTFGTASAGSNTTFGLDRGYVKYKNDGFSIWAGKNGINFWSQTEIWWDEDTQPEGIAATWKSDFGLTLNGAYFLLTEGNWQGQVGATDDLAMFTYQGVYSTKMNDIKLTAAIGGATLLEPAPGAFASEDAWTAGLQVKGSNWRVGGEFFGSTDAPSEDTGYTIQGRYKLANIGNGLGLRVYYYDIGAFSLPADGLFTQDNFPSAGANATNFTGWRFQLDYKLAKNVSADARYYFMEAKTQPAPVSPLGIAMKRDNWSRAQLNINVKF